MRTTRTVIAACFVALVVAPALAQTGEKIALSSLPGLQQAMIFLSFVAIGIGIVAYQGLAATAFAVWAQTTVLRSLPAISTNLTLMMIPVVGILSSALIVDERITAALLSGLVLILAGVSLNLQADRQAVRLAPPPAG